MKRVLLVCLTCAAWFVGAVPRALADAREEIMLEAERALRAAETDKAGALFEQAASLKHAADAELGIVRVHMQSGNYRQALSFAAHTAGAHPESAAGAGLYAWLLHIGAQTKAAKGVLARARERLPSDPVIDAAESLLSEAAPVAAGLLLQAPGRLAPSSPGSDSLARNLRPAASGVLVDAGRAVLTSAAGIGPANEAWVRDGLGRISRAQVVRRFPDLELVELLLDTPLDARAGTLRTPARDPFPGSPGFAVEYSTGDDATPAWPLLRAGFLGAASQSAGIYELGVDVPRSAHGGPVFDAAGRLAGIAIPNPQGRSRIVLASMLKRRFGEAIGPASDEPPGQRMPVDAVYERALVTAVQVLTR